MIKLILGLVALALFPLMTSLGGAGSAWLVQWAWGDNIQSVLSAYNLPVIPLWKYGLVIGALIGIQLGCAIVAKVFDGVTGAVMGNE